MNEYDDFVDDTDAQWYNKPLAFSLGRSGIQNDLKEVFEDIAN